MDSENYYVREVRCVEMADKENYTVAVHNAKKDYYLETTLTYTPPDGGKGYIVKVREKNK